MKSAQIILAVAAFFFAFRSDGYGTNTVVIGPFPTAAICNTVRNEWIARGYYMIVSRCWQNP
jgi:hypothetical protein